jgi:hypothetical protein
MKAATVWAWGWRAWRAGLLVGLACGLPVRFGVPPEISRLTLRAAPGARE